MDLSRLLNPLGPDSEQAPPPSSEPATHNDSSFYTSSSTFHGQQYENNNSQDRQEFDNTGNRRHGGTSSVEQLGGLATLHIEGGHHYRNQQLSSRHEHPVYDPSPQHIQVRPGLYSRSSWDNNNYFSGMEDTLMDHQDQQQQEHELEQLTSPRTKRKYLKKLPSSFAEPSRRGSNQQDSDEQDSSSTSNSNTTNNSSTNSTGGTGSGGGGEGGGNISSSGASTAKRRRPALGQNQETVDPTIRQGGAQQQQQQPSKCPAQQTQQQQLQSKESKRSNSGMGIGSGTIPSEPGSLVAAAVSSIASTPTGTTVLLTFERSGDGKIRCTFPRCGKEFSSESRLSTHIRIHSGKPPYPCDYPGCTKAFHTSSSLSHHRVVHSDQGLRPFVCRHDNCGATYTQLARLITHQRTTHNDVKTPTAGTGSGSGKKASAESTASATTTDGHNINSKSYNNRTPSRTASRSIEQQQRHGASADEDESDDMRQRREAAMTMANFWELVGDDRVTSPVAGGTRPAPLPPPSSLSLSPQDQYPPQDHRLAYPPPHQQQHHSSSRRSSHSHQHQQQEHMYQHQDYSHHYHQQLQQPQNRRQSQGQHHYTYGSRTSGEMDYGSEHRQQQGLYYQEQQGYGRDKPRRYSRSDYPEDDRPPLPRYRDTRP